MSYPRYVQAGTIKWEKPDLDAVVDHVLAGESDTGFYAYPYSFIVRNIGGVYDAVDSTGTRVYGGAADEGGVDGSDGTAVLTAVMAASPSVVVLGELDLTLTAAQTYPSMFRLVGQGAGRTILRSAVNDYIFKPAVATEKNHVQFSDLQFIATADGAAQGVIDLTGASFSTLDNLKLSNTSTKANVIGIQLSDPAMVGCYFNQLRNVDVSGYKTGILLKDGGAGWYCNNNSVYGGRYIGCTTGIDIQVGSTNWLFNPDFEGNTKAITCSGAVNGLLGGYFEGNTTDIETTDADAEFLAIGCKRDIVITETAGYVQFLGTSYGSADEYRYLHAFPTGMTLSYMYHYLGLAYGDVNTTYISPGTACSKKMDFLSYQPKWSRIVVTAIGNEVGNGKGICIYNTNTAQVVCEVTWNGDAMQALLAGAWTALPAGILGQQNAQLDVRIKGASATEDITIYMVDQQFK